MVKHAQTIHWLLQKNCLSVFDHFVVLALKGLTSYYTYGLYETGSGGTITLD